MEGKGAAGEQSFIQQAAQHSTQQYENKRQQLNAPTAQEFLDKILSSLQEKAENLGEKPEEKELFTIESFTNVLMSARHIDRVASFLEKAGYSGENVMEILEKNYSNAEEAYVAARMEGKTDREARRDARRAQRDYLSTVHSSLGKRHRRRFEEESGAAVRQGEIAARALETQDEKAIDAAFDAVTEEEQRKAVRDYGLMSDFAANALFASTTDMFSSAQEAPAQEMGSDSPSEAGMEALDSFLAEEQRAKDETKNWEELDKQIKELEGKKGEELDSQAQEGLEKYGVEEGSTAKEAAQYLKEASGRAKGESERLGELRTPEHFVQDKAGNWTLEEDTREGAQYAKMPAFYSPKQAAQMITAAKPMIADSPAEFSVLVAREFAGDGIRHPGTAREVLEDADFENEAAPETVVLAALSDPSNRERREEMEKVLANPLSVGIRAALLEAYARAVTELAEKR